MDNQQVTQFEFGWLSGIIDGEGCFSMSKGSKGSYNVSIKLVNTDELIILRIEVILRKLKIPYHRYNAHRTGNQRPAWRVEINGPKRIKTALDILLPYITAKQDQAKAMYDYVCTRLNTPYGQLDAGYSEGVCELLKYMKHY